MMRKLIIGIALMITGTACEKADFGCADVVNKRENEPISLEGFDFSSLIVEDDINLTIVEDSISYFDFHYDEGLLESLQFYTDGDTLILENSYNCLNRQKIETPHVYWHTNKDKNSIIFLSSGRLTNHDTLRNEFQFRAEDIVNEVDLVFNNAKTTILFNTATNFQLSGYSQVLLIRNYFGLGRLNAEALETKQINLLHRGFNDMIVNASDLIEGRIDNPGRLIIKGSAEVNLEITNGGEVVYR